MYSQKKTFDKPFCGLTLTMRATGQQAPKFEYYAMSNSMWKCSLTKKKYKLSQINEWAMTPEVQEYIKAGYVGKYGMRKSTIENKYGDDNLLEVVFYMTKPRSVGTFKTVAQTMPRPQQTYQPQPQAQQSYKEPMRQPGDDDEWDDQF